ncbi:hypothetical protein [Moraxella caprae]|uniref:hypothetical protein n=1 Tax=Moraxella caprae TaxID=90240 RepID=UPI000428DDFB|nr:hypothetical protein [Moraxella caprae]
MLSTSFNNANFGVQSQPHKAYGNQLQLTIRHKRANHLFVVLAHAGFGNVGDKTYTLQNEKVPRFSVRGKPVEP